MLNASAVNARGVNVTTTTYRINVIQSQNGGAISIAELELYESLAGADISASAIATASSQFGGNAPSYAINNDGTSSIWDSGGSPVQWIDLTFPGNVPYIAKVTLQARTSEPWQSPVVFELLKSQNGGAFVLVFTGVNLAAWGHGEVRTYLNPFAQGEAYTSTRIKFNITSNGYGWPCCADLKMYPLNGGANLALNRRMYVNSENAGYRYNVMDGDPNTKWQTSAGIPSYIELLFEPTLPVLHSFSWTARNDDNGNEAPYTLDVLRSQDGGVTYTTEWTQTGMGAWATGQTKTFGNPSIKIQALAAALTLTTQVQKRSRRVLAAAATLAGAVSTAGAIPQALSAAITATAALTRRGVRTLQASASATAALTPREIVGQLLSASVTAVATTARVTQRQITASITSAGDLLRRTVTQVSAGLAATAAVLRRSPVRVSASSTSTATLANRIVVQRLVSAAMTGATTIARQVRRVLSASNTMSAILTTRSVLRRSVVAAVNGGASLLRQAQGVRQAMVTGTTTVARRTSYRAALLASMTAGTTIVRALRRRLSASLTALTSVGLQRRAVRLLAAAVGLTAELGRRQQLRRSLSAAVIVTSVLTRRLRRQLQALMTVMATLASGNDLQRTLVASVTTVASVWRRAARWVAGSLLGAAGLGRQGRRHLAASSLPSSTLTGVLAVRRVLSASVTGVVSRVRAVGRRITAAAEGVGSLQQQGRRVLRASSALTTQIRRAWAYLVPAASVTVGATTRGQFGRKVQATIAVTRSLLTTLIDAVAGWSGLLTAQITLQSRYTPEVHLTTGDADVTLQGRYDGDMAVDHADVPLRLES